MIEGSMEHVEILVQASQVTTPVSLVTAGFQSTRRTAVALSNSKMVSEKKKIKQRWVGKRCSLSERETARMAGHRNSQAG